MNNTQQQAETAKPKTSEQSNSIFPQEQTNKPERWARRILEKLFITRDAEGIVSHLRVWKGDFYAYDENCGIYKLIDQSDMRIFVTNFLNRPQTFIPHDDLDNQYIVPCENITRGLVDNILLNLQGYDKAIHLSSDLPIPRWIDGKGLDKNRRIVMATSTLSIDKLIEGNQKQVVFPHTARWFDTIKIPYDYNPDAVCLRWIAFLDEVLEGDVERIKLLQQWMGYLLTPDTSRQKFMICAGQGGNGKGVVFSVLTDLLGRDNCSHIPLERFGERFALGATINKLANICGDAAEITKVAEGVLKSYTGEDSMTFERKYRDPITVRPTARLMFSCNRLPFLGDKTQGVWRRLLLMPFQYSVPDSKVNRHLADELRQELPGIFLWAVEGLRSLQSEGDFVQPSICKIATTEYQQDCDPALEFLADYYRSDEFGSVDCGQVYQKYVEWCGQNGYHPANSRNFGKSVKRQFPDSNRKQARAGSTRYYIYGGIIEND